VGCYRADAAKQAAGCAAAFTAPATCSNGFFNKIKQRRRIAARYDKFAANYLAFIQLALIRLWLRVNESTP